MKASDITDEEFLAALEPGGRWTLLWKVQERLGNPPQKIVIAKARTMIVKKRGLHGCPCGCRGDFHRASECKGC